VYWSGSTCAMFEIEHMILDDGGTAGDVMTTTVAVVKQVVKGE